MMKPIDYVMAGKQPLCPHCLSGFMDEQYNTRVTCGKENMTFASGVPCSREDWDRCPLNEANRPNPPPVGKIAEQHRTLYSSLPMQIFLTKSVKERLMESVNTLFSGGFDLKRKITAVKLFRQACAAIDKIPEPTFENTWHPNTHNLIDLVNSLKRHWLLGPVLKMTPAKQLVKLGIIIYDFDPPWRWIIDSVKDRLLSDDWTFRNLTALRDWICASCALADQRVKFIRNVMNAGIFLYYTPCRPLMNLIKSLALRKEWKQRGFQDNWSQGYTWWRDIAYGS